jgi:pimeloyl-ACP methyl ester carboxylesterase
MTLQSHEGLLGNRTVRWRETGSGPAVVVAPGLGLTGRFYERNAPAFAKAGYRFIVPDMPSLGGTRGARTGTGVQQNAQFLISFLDLLGLQRVHWIGHSLGAQHALRAAVIEPARARSMCLAGPTGGHRQRAARILHQAAGIAHEALIAGPRVVGAVLRDYVRVSPVAYLGTWLRASPDEPERDLRALQCPVLFIVGTNDRVADRTYVERLARNVQGARIAWLRGGGHALPRSAADDFNDAVIGFLQAVDRAR